MFKALTVVVLPTLFLFLPSRETQAASPTVCNNYVERAVQAAEVVRARSCAFDLSHPQWSTDPNVHRRWCLRDANQETVETEDFNRHNQVDRCRTCRDYADQAVAAAAENIKLNCKLSGPRWGESPEAHFGWCMSP
jgi:hypothetical protein